MGAGCRCRLLSSVRGSGGCWPSETSSRATIDNFELLIALWYGFVVKNSVTTMNLTAKLTQEMRLLYLIVL